MRETLDIKILVSLYELIDNSYEANATKFLLLAKNKSGTNQPESLAVIDNGMECQKDFLHTAVKLVVLIDHANKPLKEKATEDLAMDYQNHQ